MARTPKMDGDTDTIKVEEGEVKVLACKLCPKQYYGKNKLVKHMKEVAKYLLQPGHSTTIGGVTNHFSALNATKI